jgi:hypothetical protein
MSLASPKRNLNGSSPNDRPAIGRSFFVSVLSAGSGLKIFKTYGLRNIASNRSFRVFVPAATREKTSAKSQNCSMWNNPKSKAFLRGLRLSVVKVFV